MKDCCKRQYARGYSRGARWPEHRPPAPPHEIVGAIAAAAKYLRDEVGGFLATIDQDDPLQEKLGQGVDELDRAFVKLAKWLKSEEIQ